MFFGCSGLVTPAEDNESEITDISASLSYRFVTNLGFMGGSLPYNPDEISSSPIRKNAVIAIRLGYVERTDINTEQSVFEDISNNALYGLLKISSI